MWAVASTVRNRTTVLAEATSIAKSEPVREEFAWQISEAMVPHSASSNPIDINRANDVARRAVESDAFQQAFVAALPAIYDRVVEGTGCRRPYSIRRSSRGDQRPAAAPTRRASRSRSGVATSPISGGPSSSCCEPAWRSARSASCSSPSPSPRRRTAAARSCASAAG